MKKRIPFTEPYTPEETAELARAIRESEARMTANVGPLVNVALARAWIDPEEPSVAAENAG